MAEYQVVINDLSRVQELAAQIEQSAQDGGLDAEKRMDIRLCVSEALYNALIHGNQLDREKNVWIKWRVALGELEVSVMDEGPGIPRDKRYPRERDMTDLLGESGKGIYLISQLAADVCYNERGNQITMRMTW